MKTFRTGKSSNRKGTAVKKKEANEGGAKNRVLTRAMHVRLMISLGVIVLGLIGLMIKVYAIQSNSKNYNQKVLAQQRYNSSNIPYRRGDIMDRNGTYLATSNKVYNLIIDPYQINQAPEKYLAPTAALLAEVFGYNEEDIKNIITQNADSRYIRQEKELSYEIKEQFESRRKEINSEFAAKDSKSRIYGVWFEDAYQRVYPYNSLACNAIGFANKDNTLGTGGIEQYYNDELIGVAGREYGYLNDDYNLERVIKTATDGNSIISTLDTNIQKIVEKHISEWEAQMGSKITACLVMDPNNGEILAMATSKTYDLNHPRNIDKYYTQEEFNALDTKAQSEVMNDIWRNYCVNDTYEPGSPAKILTVAAALEEGTVKPEDSFYCDGGQVVGDRIVHCAVRSGHGNVTLKESLIRSCNDAIMQVASGLGTDRFSNFEHLFGMGVKSGIDLPGEPDTSALIHQAADMKPIDLATNSFGQNYNCTMIQMSAAICSVINGGYYYEPHIVKQVVNSQGSVIKDIEPKLVRETVSTSTSVFIREALRDVIEKGTGEAAKVEGYDVGGKTGTSQKLPRNSGKYLLSFAGFAPVDNPQVFCYVVVDEPNTDNQSHSAYAGELFSKIMTDILPYMSIFPKDEEAAQKIQEEVEARLKGEETSAAESTAQAEQNDSEASVESSKANNANTPSSTEYETEEYLENPRLDFESPVSPGLSSEDISNQPVNQESKQSISPNETAGESRKAVAKKKKAAKTAPAATTKDQAKKKKKKVRQQTKAPTTAAAAKKKTKKKKTGN